MSWRRLTGMDAAFLYGETDNAPLHVLALIELASRSREPGADFARVRAQVAARLPALAILRHRVVEVPLGLDAPVWVEDPDFDLDAHLFRSVLPPPGGRRELECHVAQLAEVPLRRHRPLWEIHVVEGLAGRRFALIAKVHHAAVDGVGGIGVLAALLDTDPEGKALIPAEPPAEETAEDEPGRAFELAPELVRAPERTRSRSSRAAAAPSPRELFGDAARTLVRRPLRSARQLLRSSGAGARLLASGLATAPLVPPYTRLNGCISGRRAVATGSVSLEDVKEIRRAFAATVNHVVLAACAGALRRYLAAFGEIPRTPLVAAVPMALGGRAADGSGNALSVLRVRLPVHHARALDRLAAAREASFEAMRAHEAAGPQLGGWAELPPPLLFAGATRLYRGLGLARRHPPLHNVVISNVPGPAQTLWCAGARVTACHPFGPLYEGWGLNLTVLSYAGRVALGAIACPERVPHVERIPQAFEACVAQLHRLATGGRRPEAERRADAG